MTLKNRKLYLGAILAVTLIAGLSGVLQAEAVTTGKDSIKYKTCEEKTKFGKTKAKIVHDHMKLKFGVWEINDNQKQKFEMAYTFPETIYEFKPGVLGNSTCEPLKQLVKIILFEQGENQYDYDDVQTCIDRDFLSDHAAPFATVGSKHYPSTNGTLTIGCNLMFSLFDIGNEQVLSVRAIYDNLETEEQEQYTLDSWVTVRN